MPLFVTLTNSALAMFLLLRLAIPMHRVGNRWGNGMVVVFAISVALRIILSLVNADSHDGHDRIINLIANEYRLPTLADCVQCYSPKLYYVVVAFFVELLDLANTHARIMIAQGLSCAGGLLNLFLIGRFLAEGSGPDRSRFWVFGLLALNPNIIGFCAMGSNDSWVFLFTTLAVLAVLKFFRHPVPLNIGAIAGWTVCAALTKGSGMVLFGATVGLISLRLIGSERKGERRHCWAALVAYGVLFTLLIPPLGQYNKVEQTGGTIIFNPPEKAPFPHFFRETTYNEEEVGVRSVFGALMTFRIIDLLKHPQRELQHAHETSLWSSLHGGFHSVYFCRAPRTWRTNHEGMNHVARGSFVLGLIPLAFLVVGLAHSMHTFRGMIATSRWRAGLRCEELVLLTMLLAYIMAEIAWTLLFRDSDAMRPVYLFPALLAFAYFTVKGADAIVPKINAGSIHLRSVLDLFVAALFALYLIQGFHLAANLARALTGTFKP